MYEHMTIDYSKLVPIYQEINFSNSNPESFQLPAADRTNLCSDIRCESFKIIPHVHGTHLEAESHVDLTKSNERPPLSLSQPLITTIIEYEEIMERNPRNYSNESAQFVIIKKAHPKRIGFEGVDPMVVDELFLRFPKIQVIGVNEPSFDPESDNCSLRAHKRAFANGNGNIFLVELLDLSGTSLYLNRLYTCFLNLYRFGVSDAYPCSPILYEVPGEMLNDSCLFCKIIRGTIPSFKVYENSLTYAFLDINPLSEGHILIIPKFHGAKLHEVTDDHLSDILPVARKIMLEAFGNNGTSPIPAYNILQNNGRLAHQEVDHVHFHLIPKRTESEGLGIKWPTTTGNMAALGQYAESIRTKLHQ